MSIINSIISKKIFLLTLLAFPSISFAKLSAEAISDVYDNQLEGAAKYLEYYLVFQPSNKIQSASMDLTVGISATAAALFLTTKIDTVNKKVGTIDNLAAITSATLFIAAGYAYHCKLERAIKRETLMNFLNNWTHHRQFVPDEFSTAFDELAANVTAGQTLTDAQIGEICELVQHYIEHCFIKRYPKEKKSTDLLGSLKTITEIGKNMTPAPATVPRL